MILIYAIIGLFIAFSAMFFVKAEINTTVVANPPEVIKEVIPNPDENIIKEIVETEPENIVIPEKVLHDVPFTSQAPFGNWADAEQNYGCEEASLLMAVYWAHGKKLTSEIALREIKAMSKFEQEKYGDFHDTSIADTLDLLKTYLKHENAFAKYDIGVEDIKKELAKGNLVVVPINGRILGNIYFTPPGPFLHQMVIVGYDDTTQEFISHDPGTMKGGNYRYGYKTVERALMDYPTGFNEPVNEIRSAMISIGK